MVHAESFSEFRKSQLSSYSKFKEERDAEFDRYLKQQWQAYKKFVSPALYEKPKPKTIPQARPKTVPKVGPKVVIKEVPKAVSKPPKLPPEVALKTKPHLLQKEPSKQPKPKEQKRRIVHKDIEFVFFGVPLGFDIPKQIQKARFYPTNQRGIANYFEQAASSDYTPLLRKIKAVRTSLRLNDWGVYLLVDTIAHKLYKYDDEANLFDWFIFNKLGYSVKVGLQRGHVLSMFYSKKIIYSTPNFRFGKKRYFVLAKYGEKLSGSIYSYKQNYPNATKAFDLTLKELPLFPPEYIAKTVNFKFEGRGYSVSYKLNKNLLDFFATYPQADYATFFNAAIDPITHASLIESLRPHLNGKRAAEAMNLVLAFVQKAFRYETDKQQFHREKVMFAEETLFYPASDCEDRAILYAYLTKKLFKVPVLGVKYPNHMATALYIPLEGDKVRIKNKEFVIADPTYINATIGEAMPQFKGKMPEDFVFVTLKD